MRLGVKIFLATSLVIILMLGVAGWSLLAVRQLVEGQYAVVTRALPALQLESALRTSLQSLTRLHMRHAVTGDPAYARLWRARIERTTEDLRRLGERLESADERRWYRKLVAAFTAYRSRSGLDDEASVAGMPILDIRSSGARVEHSLMALDAATVAAVDAARARAREVEQRTWRTVSGAALASVLVAVLAVGLLAHGMTRSLRRLADAAGEVARGRFPEALGVRSRDEIGELAAAFTKMASKLREIDRLKQEVFAHVAHELRTPLTSVREAAGLLRDEIPGTLTAKQGRLVEIVRQNTERMLVLVNQILDLGRLRGGVVVLDRRPVDVAALVARALDTLRPRADAQGIALVGTNDAVGAGTMLGDEERLLQVVVNLVDNAIKFTPAGGAVRIGLAGRPDVIDITVEDTGSGIPPALLAHVFDRYWQGNSHASGSGLGLAIVKSVVEAHGGSVDVASTEGRGSRFAVRLPRQGPGG